MSSHFQDFKVFTLTVLAITFQLCYCLNVNTRGNSRPNSQHFSNQPPINILNNNENRGRDDVRNGEPQWPWRHHIDFDEKYPGEDQIAMETSRTFPFPPHGNPMFQPRHPDMFHPPLPPQPQLPNFFDQKPDRSQHWWPLMRTVIIREPWWKGPNVCLSREEEDQSIEAENVKFAKKSTNETSEGIKIEKNETESGSPEFQMRFSSCDNLDTRYTCKTRMVGPNIIRRIKTNYECCHGHFLNEKTQECERGDFKNMLDSLEEISGELFKHVKSLDLSEILLKENITLFAPGNEAVQAFVNAINHESTLTNNLVTISLERDSSVRRGRNVMNGTKEEAEEDNSPTIECPAKCQLLKQVKNGKEDWKKNVLEEQSDWKQRFSYDHQSEEMKESIQQAILSNIIPGKLSTDDFVDEKVIFSQDGKSQLRLNTWEVEGEKVKTVNCARLISINHQCTNGYIHLVDRMVKPVRKSIIDVLSSEPQFSTFYSLLQLSPEIFARIQNSESPVTLFVPTNEAMNKTGEISLFLNKKSGDLCLERMLKHHILPITFCSSLILNEGHVRNMNKESLNVARTSNDQLFIEDSEIILRDVVTTNGVLHIIDRPIVSQNDKPIVSELERLGLTSFLDAITEAGLKDTLESISNVTLFVPTNEAMSMMGTELRNNSQKLKEVLSYHISTFETRACHFFHEQRMPTMLGPGRSIRMNLYSGTAMGRIADMTAQCGRILNVNKMACNGIIHTIDRILIPPDFDIVDSLKTKEDISIFTKLIEETNLSEFLREKGPFTLFVPTDAAFYALEKETLERILNSKEEALWILKRHISEENICCSGIAPNLWLLPKSVETLSGAHLHLYRDHSGQPVFGNSRFITCDLTSSNGVIHTVDRVIIRERAETRMGVFQRPCCNFPNPYYEERNRNHHFSPSWHG